MLSAERVVPRVELPRRPGRIRSLSNPPGIEPVSRRRIHTRPRPLQAPRPVPSGVLDNDARGSRDAAVSFASDAAEGVEIIVQTEAALAINRLSAKCLADEVLDGAVLVVDFDPDFVVLSTWPLATTSPEVAALPTSSVNRAAPKAGIVGARTASSPDCSRRVGTAFPAASTSRSPSAESVGGSITTPARSQDAVL